MEAPPSQHHLSSVFQSSGESEVSTACMHNFVDCSGDPNLIASLGWYIADGLPMVSEWQVRKLSVTVTLHILEEEKNARRTPQSGRT